MAVKILTKKNLSKDQKIFLESEICMLRKVNCALIPKLNKVYEDDSNIYLTFPYFHGEDLLRIVLTSHLEEMAIATLIYHILKGLKQLHSANYFHGNLKLENIIFSSAKKENEIYLINPRYQEELNNSFRDKLIKKGSNMYIAPEILEGKPFGTISDMFSIGCCIFYIVFGRYPYKSITNTQ